MSVYILCNNLLNGFANNLKKVKNKTCVFYVNHIKNRLSGELSRIMIFPEVRVIKKMLAV